MATMVNRLPFTTPAMPRLGLADLEQRFRRLTLVTYDTSAPISTLEAEVYPYLAPGIEFVNPWRRTRGAETYRADLSGTRGAVPFDIDISQLDVRLLERRDAGRALVDGTLYLRPLPRCAYPLRVVLTYDFDMIEGGEIFQITRHEEMWSFGDMLRIAPLAARSYDVFRSCAGYLFTGVLLLSGALAGRLSGAGAGHDGSR